MGKGVVNPDVINLTVIASALVAAIAWNLITWWLGLPSSSSHTLVGGLVGAAVAHSGLSSVVFCRCNKNCFIYCYCTCSWYGYVIYNFRYCDLYFQKSLLLRMLISISGGFNFYLHLPLVLDMEAMMLRNQWELSGLL